MAKHIQTSIGANYLRAGWGKEALLREVLSNARDAVVMHDAVMEVSHAGSTLKVVTKGATMSRRNMLLGGGNKFGRSDTIGQFEEGLKLALLVAARESIPVKIHTGDEIWKPSIRPSTQFDGEPVLTISVSNTSEYFDGVRVEIGKTSKKEWEAERVKYLFLLDDEHIGRVKPSEYANTDVLTHPSQKGRVYVKGVFVQTMEDIAYGYDIRDAAVDRDRKMVNPYSAKYSMTEALVGFASKNGDAAKILYTQASLNHSDGAGYNLHYAPESVVDNLVEAFDAEHGEGAIACENADQVKALRNLGKPAAIAPEHLRSAIVLRRGHASVAIAQAIKAPSKTHLREDLTTSEIQNLDMAVTVLTDAGYTAAVDVVTFPDDSVLGQISLKTGMIYLSRKTLGSLKTAVSTLIHEIAHRESGAIDGAIAHCHMVETIWEKVWAKAFGV